MPHNERSQMARRMSTGAGIGPSTQPLSCVRSVFDSGIPEHIGVNPYISQNATESFSGTPQKGTYFWRPHLGFPV